MLTVFFSETIVHAIKKTITLVNEKSVRRSIRCGDFFTVIIRFSIYQF